MKRLLYYISGYYLIGIKGKKPLEYVNALKENGISFRAFKKTSENEYELKLSVFKAEAALKLAEGSNEFEVSIKKKSGIPFLLSKYRKRYGIFFGAIIGAAVIYMSQFYLWDIRINVTNDPEQSAHILYELEKIGFRPGIYIPEYNVRNTEVRFLVNNPEYNFISINVVGNVANVDVRRRTEKPDIIDRDGMCDIVAERDGIIISADALQGTPKVKEGDVVAKGDLLISCVTVGRYGTYRLCKAIGTVKAVTYREYETSVPLKQTVKEYTGRTETKTSYEIVGKRFDLFIDETSPFEKCDAESEKETVTVFGRVRLPVIKHKTVYREYAVSETLIGAEEAREIAQRDFNFWCEREISGDILETDKEFAEDENGVTLKCFLKVAEEIGVEKEVVPGEIDIPETDTAN
ncbi:MAG: sporulation protein YqfD [Clostridia bacterium]|nr:sporulation protein YqfD [Clostridia bacterium]